MNVLYVLPRFPAASETFVAEEVLGLRARGHIVTAVALARPTEVQISKMGERLKSLICTTVYLPRVPLLNLGSLVWAKSSARALNVRMLGDAPGLVHSYLRFARAAAIAKHARQCRADLIYAHWPRPSEVALLAGEISGLPVGLSIHAHEVAHDNGHFPIAFERIRFAAFCNGAAMNYLLSRLPRDARRKAHLIYHGVDIGQFPRTPLPSFDGVLQVITAGRLTPTKGIDRLIRIMAMARDRGVAVALTVIGDGSQKSDLEALASGLGLLGRVRFVGWVPHEEMRELLSGAHVFALLADDTFHDGLPNVVMEAMSLGRPCILSPLPAASEVVEHGVNGYILARVDAPGEFVNCCAALAKDPDKLSRWSRAAAETAHARYDRAGQLDRLCELFADSIRCGH